MLSELNEPARLQFGHSATHSRKDALMSRILESTAAPLGRVLLSAIFLMSGANKIMNWSKTAEHMEGEGMQYVPFLLAAAIVFEIGGGLSLLLGCWARLGAFLLIVFLIPTTLIFHDFWTYEGSEQQTQMINFMKNLAIMGGLLIVFALGAGRLRVTGRKKSHS